jgi:hypothetical protein
MTELQKDTVTKLLMGYTIAASGKNGFRLRSPEAHPCRKISIKTFQKIKKVLRKQKGLFVVNKNKIRQLHGNTFIKKEYKSIKL